MRKATIIKKLNTAGISLEGLEIETDQIEICIGYVEENGSGQCDDKKVSEAFTAINKAIPEFNGGFSTGYGAMIAQIGYVSKGDWNDPCSAHHY